MMQIGDQQMIITNGSSLQNSIAHGQLISLPDGQQAILMQAPSDENVSPQIIPMTAISGQSSQTIQIPANGLQNMTFMMNPKAAETSNGMRATQTPPPKESTGDEESEEPLYVNAKQYDRIMKRRQARAELENRGRIPKVRVRKFLHESRHKHAMNRQRGQGGRFVKKND